MYILLDVGNGPIGWQTSRRGGETADEGCFGQSRLGNGVSSTAVRDGDSSNLLAVGNSRGESSHVGTGVRHGLASGYAVVRVEGRGEEGVRVVSSMGPAGYRSGRGARHGRTLKRQWPGGGLHFLIVGEIKWSVHTGISRERDSSLQGIPKTTGHTFEEAIANDLGSSEKRGDRRWTVTRWGMPQDGRSR